MRFRTTLELAGKTATGFVVPAEVVDALGRGRKPPVKVTINGHTYRNTVAVYGGIHMIGVSAENRRAAGVAAGDEIDVDLELDTDERTVEVPPDLAGALAVDDVARAAFERLSYSRQRWYVLSVTGAKTEATRLRRVATAITQLRGHP